MGTLKTWVYICIRIAPGSWEHDIQLVTASRGRAETWLDLQCTREPEVFFFYTRRMLEDL